MANDLGKGKKRSVYERRTELMPHIQSLRTGFSSPSFGIPWIAIHGKDSVCAVSSTRSRYVDNKDQLRNCLSQLLTTEIVNPSTGGSFLIHSSERSIDKGAVVSISGYQLEDECDIEALSDHLGEQVAINFLSNVVKTYPALTYEVTIKTAISALCYLLHADLVAHEIEVVSIKDIGSVLPLPLPLPLPEEEIEKVLASISREAPELKICRHTNHGARKNRNKRK